ncbi:hypothetical protein FHETE_2711 [Fusarium heterosporum]|uniref:Uncharacterized protein n=1 Tax=Fusarium heterosporum TaxID=42747 RepID=A0A8H5WXT1_FUSHE|nr:hypothetical protein FHETE_2711 [Fusarium heterosporum]
MAPWMNFSFWRPALANDRHEDRPATSRWLGKSRAIQFDDSNWVSVPEEILKHHPHFLQMWEGRHVLYMSDIPYHVAHIVVHYLNTNQYQNLKVQRSTETERTTIDFITAVFTHSVATKYQLPTLRQFAGERIVIYGDTISFVEIVKILSNKPFESMKITGQLYDYICHRSTKEGELMSTKSAEEIQQAIGGTMAGVLCQRIAKLEVENKHLKGVLGSH